MPAKDLFHDIVKNALVKEDWMITDDPLFLQYGGFDSYIDLGAEKIVAFEKAGNKIAVKIKSFIGKSFIYEFHQAIGQFIHYRLVLTNKEPERILYLAIPDDSYQAYFTLLLTTELIETYQIKYLVYDIEQEIIIKWQT
jgi:hypothetical protein